MTKAQLRKATKAFDREDIAPTGKPISGAAAAHYRTLVAKSLARKKAALRLRGKAK